MAQANPITETRLTEADQLQSILEITRSLASQIHLDDLLDTIVREATNLLVAERTTLYLVDKEKGELWSKIAQQTQQIRLPIGRGLAGHVAATGEIINLSDAYKDPRFNRDTDRQTGFRTRSMLVMPMVNHEGQIIGVLQVMNKREGTFGNHDEQLLGSLTSSAAIAVENAQLYSRIVAMLHSFIRTLAATIDARDPETAGHSHRVGEYSAALAREMSIPEPRVRFINLAGLLHDYGKIGVPEAILTKPGRLTPEETIIMQHHARKTKEVLSNVQFTDEFRGIAAIAAQHHERVDGQGYPDGLKDEQISLEGKVLAVADVFDALTWRRYYRDPMSQADARDFIVSKAGSHFHPEVVMALDSIFAREGGLMAALPPTDGQEQEEVVVTTSV